MEKNRAVSRTPALAIDKARALNRAAALCSGSEQCAADIREKLLRWGLDEYTAAEIIARLTDEGFLDERRYARAFTHDHIRYQHWGRVKIACALRQKHVNGEAVREALWTIDDEWADEYADALRHAVGTERSLTPRLLRRVASRGFTQDELHRLLRTLPSD